MRVTFADGGGAPSLEVDAPIRHDSARRLWSTLAAIRVRPVSPYQVRTRDRLVSHLKLCEWDGSPVSQRRVGQILSELRLSLTHTPLDAAGLQERTVVPAARPNQSRTHVAATPAASLDSAYQMET
jgi:hypothetical protein